MPTCPTCGLFNPPDAIRCDCGYRFVIESTGVKRCPECGATHPTTSTLCPCGYHFPPDRLSVQPQRGVSWLYQLCLVLILRWTVICAVGACYGLMKIASEPTPTDSYAKAGRDVGIALGLGMWAVVWVIPTMGLGVIGLLVKPR